jgi:hypothetical protein
MHLLLLAALSAAIGSAPAQDSVTGTIGTGEPRDAIDFGFDVSSGPSGENPTGTVAVRLQLGTTTTLGISCLSVAGDRARVIVVAPPNAGIAGLGVDLQDAGTAGPDRLGFQILATLPPDCPVSTAVLPVAERGDVTIVDAPPLPASKDQCKNDGWRSYGFKNQGACVSFVNAASRRAR